MEKNLSFKGILSSAFSIGVKNFIPLLLAYLLWIVTIWIPVINVGTTIALVTIPAQLSRGDVINPLSIFDGKYRKYMGEYFLVTALQNIIVCVGFFFCIIPGIMAMYSYMFAPILVVDKGINPSEALTKSNEITYGHKLSIFLAFFVLSIPLIIPIVNIIYMFLFMPILLSAMGYIYGALSADAPVAEAEPVAAE